MAVVKEGLEVHDVIVQEGVYTFETVNDAVAEPVVYMIDHYVVGGFYRVHTERGKDENLNAPGMHFVPLAFASSRAPRPTRTSPALPAEPLLRLRRGRAAGAAGRLARARAHRTGRDSRRRRAAPTDAFSTHERTMKLAFIVDPLDELQDLQGHAPTR